MTHPPYGQFTRDRDPEPERDYYNDTDRRMMGDAVFSAAVHYMMALAREHAFTPGELKQIAFRAALELEMRSTRSSFR